MNKLFLLWSHCKPSQKSKQKQTGKKADSSKKPCSSHKIQIGKFFDVISLPFHLNFNLILPCVFLDSYENVISKIKCLINIEFLTQKGQRVRYFLCFGCNKYVKWQKWTKFILYFPMKCCSYDFLIIWINRLWSLERLIY